MAVPDFQSMLLPLLRLTEDGGQHRLAAAVEGIADGFQLTEQDRTELLKSGSTRLYNRVCWTATYLKKAGLLQAVGAGRFQITERGKALLASNPTSLDVGYLESKYPEMIEFRRSRGRTEEEAPAIYDAANNEWQLRDGIQARIKKKLESSIPNEQARLAALAVFAAAIDNADEENSSAWFVKERAYGIRLMTGRLIACSISRAQLRVSVMGPVTEETRNALGALHGDDEEFKTIPGAVLLSFPAERSEVALAVLKDGLDSFVDLAIARVRSSVSLEDHAPEAVAHISQVVGRTLPQPIPSGSSNASGSAEADRDEDDQENVSREPKVRGRAPIFEHGQRSIASLVSDIEREVIALPDLQRPFVWEDTRVRDLLDSLFLGFPVGTLVFWHTPPNNDARTIGAESPGLRATALVIDGQQRLTSLYAVMQGVEVVGRDGEMRKISIAFRPRDGRFEVADAAIRNDPEFLPDVSELWSGNRAKPQIRKELIRGLRDKGRPIDERYEDAVERNLDRAHAIADYRFPTVDIRRTSNSQDGETTEEDVAEIFVRINNQGMRLGQADFVLTLLSVFHGELRDRIETRSREMSQGTVVGIDTQQLLRAACGVAFGRARMSAVYRFLRGVDPITGEADTASRLERLRQLDDSAKQCMEPTPWRDYLLRVQHAGFVSPSLIASKNAIVNAYVFYIRGRNATVPKARLDAVIARWLFGTLLTARYSGSSETAFEQDLSKILRLDATDADGFVSTLDEALSDALTGDYWTRTLVSTLETQKTRSPVALAFRAAQITLGARALFSDQTLRNLYDPPTQGLRAAREGHHLFPEAWLFSHNVRERRLINQVANIADVGWHENNVIGGRGPADYVPRLRRKLDIDDDRWGRACAEHALPPNWETMPYQDFLAERRHRMADLIRVAFRQLGGEADQPPVVPPWFMPGAELVWRRITETESALRSIVRSVYQAQFGDNAPQQIELAVPEAERPALARALRARPAAAAGMSVVDYLYLGQLAPLLFNSEVWGKARTQLQGGSDVKQRLTSAVGQIAPVRNEIAHVREVSQDRLMRATVACNDILQVLRPV
jgi:hypothetical protein